MEQVLQSMPTRPGNRCFVTAHPTAEKLLLGNQQWPDTTAVQPRTVKPQAAMQTLCGRCCGRLGGRIPDSQHFYVHLLLVQLLHRMLFQKHDDWEKGINSIVLSLSTPGCSPFGLIVIAPTQHGKKNNILHSQRHGNSIMHTVLFASLLFENCSQNYPTLGKRLFSVNIST